MEIKDVEKMLDIPRSQIRFYEKQGLIHPEREENNYRCYTDANVVALKKIIVLRKLGFSVEDIAAMQNGDLELFDAARENITRLEEEMERLQEAITLSRKLAEERAVFETFDEDGYWRAIEDKEQSGARFADIAKDLALFEFELFDLMWKWTFFTDFKTMRVKHGVWKACLGLLGLCVLRGIGNVLIWQEPFWTGFFHPFIVFGIGSAIVTPLYILGKKAPRVAGWIAMVLFYLIIAFLAFLVLFIAGSFIYSFFI